MQLTLEFLCHLSTPYNPKISHLSYPAQLNHPVHPSRPASQSPDRVPQETPSSPSSSLPPNPSAQSHDRLYHPCARCCIALATSTSSLPHLHQLQTGLKLTPCQPLHCSRAHYAYRLGEPCPELHAVYRCHRDRFWFLSLCLGRWGTGLRGWGLRGRKYGRREHVGGDAWTTWSRWCGTF